MVIAIIAILAGLLLPALANAKRKALETKSRSNLRQMALAFQLFIEDNDGISPGTYGGLATTNAMWLNYQNPSASLIVPYLGGNQDALFTFFQCPLDQRANLRSYKYSFSMNNNLSLKRVVAINDPKTMAVLGEEADNNPLENLQPGEVTINDPYWLVSYNAGTGLCTPDVLTLRHGKARATNSLSADVLFADWHVGRLSRQDGKDPRYVDMNLNASGTPER